MLLAPIDLAILREELQSRESRSRGETRVVTPAELIALLARQLVRFT